MRANGGSRNFAWRLLCAGVALGGAFGARARAVELPAQARARSKTTTLQTIIVTGTRAPGQTAADSLKPIDVLTPYELRATGAPDLESALRILLPSFNFPEPSQLGATDATMPAQLRGLSPDDTLVLIDGKRQHTTAVVNVDGPMIGRGSSPVDLGAIPISAIARIEVLRDGAAAQYGSSAIAGVINIILKGAPHGGSLDVGRGVHGGMQGQTWQGGASGGIPLGTRGALRLSANYVRQDATNHIGPQTEFMAPGDAGFDRIDAHYGLPWKLAKMAAFNGHYRLGAHAVLYAFGVYNARRVVAGGAFNAPSQYDALSPAAAAIYPDGFLPMIHSAIRDDMTVAGVRGELAGWDYDVSASTGGNAVGMHTGNTFNYSLGHASPTWFYDGTLAIRQDILDGDFRRSFPMGGLDPLSVAWGFAYRDAAFSIRPGDAASFAGTGAVNGFGFGPANAGSHRRTNAAEYVDLQAPLDPKLSAEFAVRHEHYGDFGNTTVWQASGRYRFTPTLALRGTAATGFRAPSLQQEFYSSTTVEFLNDAEGVPVPYTVGTFPVASPVAHALGSQPLQPERSHSYSIGLAWNPAAGPDITLDAYQVDIANRIILSGDFTGPAVAAFLASAGIPGVTSARFFSNAVATRTRGADLTGAWRLHLQGTTVRLSAGANYNETVIRSIAPNPPALSGTGLVLPVVDRQEQGLITVGTPRTKAFVAADWRRGAWIFHGQLTRYGHWSTLGPTPAFDDRFAPRLLLDASATYVLRRWRFTLGGNNVTNTYPERNNAMNSFDGVIPYPFTSPFGFSGAFWYADLAYHWK